MDKVTACEHNNYSMKSKSGDPVHTRLISFLNSKEPVASLTSSAQHNSSICTTADVPQTNTHTHMHTHACAHTHACTHTLLYLIWYGRQTCYSKSKCSPFLIFLSLSHIVTVSQKIKSSYKSHIIMTITEFSSFISMMLCSAHPLLNLRLKLTFPFEPFLTVRQEMNMYYCPRPSPLCFSLFKADRIKLCNSVVLFLKNSWGIVKWLCIIFHYIIVHAKTETAGKQF